MNVLTSIILLLITFVPLLSLANDSDKTIKALPVATTNHVSVTANYQGKQAIYVFGGLIEQSSRQQMTNDAWRLVLSEDTENEWQPLPILPSNKNSKGHMASSAVVIDENIYLFTGFTSAKINKRMKISETYRYHTDSNHYNLLAEMPMSVADAIAVSYRDRYIYLIGGWHQDGAVNTVQVFDVLKNEWSFASPLIDHNSFGGAGAIIDNTIMLCDGATSSAQPFTKTKIVLKPKCFIGVIDVLNPFKIVWTQWQHPTDTPRYKMVAAASLNNDEFIFVGGSNVFHDFAGKSAQPISETKSQGMWIYNLTNNSWKVLDQKQNIYDLNSLMLVNSQWLTIGGMNKTGQLLNRVSIFPPLSEVIIAPN